MKTDTFTFSFEGKRMSGLIDMPTEKKASALIVIVPGSGKTYMAGDGFYHNLRTHFAKQGIACLLWDKAVSPPEYFHTMMSWLKEKGFGG